MSLLLDAVNTASGTAIATLNLTLSSSLPNDLYVIYVSTYTAGIKVKSVSSAGLSFANRLEAPGTPNSSIWYSTNTSVGILTNQTIAVAISASSDNIGIVGFTINGADLQVPWDNILVKTSGTTTSPSINSVNTSNSNDMVLGFLGYEWTGTGTITQSTGNLFTELGDTGKFFSGSGSSRKNLDITIEYDIVSNRVTNYSTGYLLSAAPAGWAMIGDSIQAAKNVTASSTLQASSSRQQDTNKKITTNLLSLVSQLSVNRTINKAFSNTFSFISNYIQDTHKFFINSFSFNSSFNTVSSWKRSLQEIGFPILSSIQNFTTKPINSFLSFISNLNVSKQGGGQTYTESLTESLALFSSYINNTTKILLQMFRINSSLTKTTTKTLVNIFNILSFLGKSYGFVLSLKQTLSLSSLLIKTTTKSLIQRISLISNLIKTSNKLLLSYISLNSLIQKTFTFIRAFTQNLNLSSSLSKVMTFSRGISSALSFSSISNKISTKILTSNVRLFSSLSKTITKIIINIITMISNGIAQIQGGGQAYTETFSDTIYILSSSTKTIGKTLLSSLFLIGSLTKIMTKALFNIFTIVSSFMSSTNFKRQVNSFITSFSSEINLITGPISIVLSEYFYLGSSSILSLIKNPQKLITPLRLVTSFRKQNTITRLSKQRIQYSYAKIKLTYQYMKRAILSLID